MNAIDFLIKEHNQVRTLLADINDASHRFETKKEKFHLCADNLIRHERMEHEVWYPHLKKQLSDEVKHLVSEEKHAEQAIKKIEALKTEEAWKEHFLKLKEDIEHHAQEEEHQLFPEVEKLFSQRQLEEIGLEMHAFKKNYLKQ